MQTPQYCHGTLSSPGCSRHLPHSSGRGRSHAAIYQTCWTPENQPAFFREVGCGGRGLECVLVSTSAHAHLCKNSGTVKLAVPEVSHEVAAC